MQRYNIALLPEKPALQAEITRIARHYFLDIQDEYILGPHGLAHVTLCQFKAADIKQAMRVYKHFISTQTSDAIGATVETFRARAGSLTNAGKFIVEYKVQAEPKLLELQSRCAEALRAHGLQSLTPFETYSPHFTLARLGSMPEKTPSEKDLSCPMDVTLRFALGLSTEEGVFVKEL